MKIRSLKNTTIEQIVICLTKAFEGYFVPMPSEVAFWSNRFANARVDKSLSWGVFEEENLVGFIINAIDYHDGVLTAFNTGTGILPQYRGRQLVDKMYQEGMAGLIQKGVKKCMLEVIDKNERAIKVYQRIGFKKTHKLWCYKGSIPDTEKIEIVQIQLTDLEHRASNQHYSWDNRWATIKKAGKTYEAYQVFSPADNSLIGYFIINPTNGYIAQLESTNGEWASIFAGISQIQKNVRINNVREDRIQLIAYLNELNFDNTINQIEMHFNILNS